MKIESIARQQMACLGDASRYRIVGELTGGQACVTELAGRIGLSQSCTTRHLQALERAGLVTRERAGRRVLFRVRSQDPDVRSLLDWKSRLETDADLTPLAVSVSGPRRTPVRPGTRRSVSRPGSSRGARRDGATGPDALAAAAAASPTGDPAQRVPAEADDRAGADRDSGHDEATPRVVPARRIREELEDFLL